MLLCVTAALFNTVQPTNYPKAIITIEVKRTQCYPKHSAKMLPVYNIVLFKKMGIHGLFFIMFVFSNKPTTHDLWNTSLLTEPLDQGSRPTT